MKEFISQKALESALDYLNAQVDEFAFREEVARIERAKDTAMPLGYRTEDVVHQLWSGGGENSIFRNNHRCWPISGKDN